MLKYLQSDRLIWSTYIAYFTESDMKLWNQNTAFEDIIERCDAKYLLGQNFSIQNCQKSGWLQKCCPPTSFVRLNFFSRNILSTEIQDTSKKYQTNFSFAIRGNKRNPWWFLRWTKLPKFWDSAESLVRWKPLSAKNFVRRNYVQQVPQFFFSPSIWKSQNLIKMPYDKQLSHGSILQNGIYFLLVIFLAPSS